MKIVLGCDHGGLALKDSVKRAIEDTGNTVVADVGTFTPDSVDYPDFAYKAAKTVASGEADKGILMCGTGIGISIAANKVRGIRCAHATDVFQAEMASAHNDANMLALGGRVTSPENAYEIVKKFLSTPFQGGRHKTRVDKITEIEKEEGTAEVRCQRSELADDL
jgi:ribose 5-phosphate isomerase B